MKAHYDHIYEVAFDMIRESSGKVSYEEVTEQVRKFFPNSKWQKSHWAWYKSRIKKGKFSDLFSDEIKQNLLKNYIADEPAERPEEQMYTWLPFFEEMLSIICKQYDKNSLCNIFHQIFEGIGGTQDKYSDTEEGPLREIDPLTFIYYFNRSMTETKRIRFCKQAKALLGMQSDVPEDFDGIPTAQNLLTWFFGWEKDRQEGEIEILWQFARQLNDGSLNDEAFRHVATRKGVHTRITSIMFICKPEQYMSLDSRSRAYLRQNGVEVKPVVKHLDKENGYSGYIELLSGVKNRMNKPFYEISYDAYRLADARDGNQPNPENKQKYWMMGAGEGGRLWEDFLHNDLIALAPDVTGDLMQYDSKESIGNKVLETQDRDANPIMDRLALWEFSREMKEGDIVIIKKGFKVLLGYGVIDSEYYFDDSRNEYKHARKVKWRKTGEWEYRLGDSGIKQFPIKTLTNITKYPGFPEQLINFIDSQNKSEEIMSAHPLNMILYGPPGTGKTYSLYERAVKIADPGFNAALRSDLMCRYKELRDSGQIQFVTFHQSYSYEEFVEGIRPCLDEDGETKYELRDGVLKQIVRLASAEFAQANRKEKIDYEKISYFKMSLGRAAQQEGEEIYDYCIENGYVSIGYGGDIDFSEAASQSDPQKRRQIVERLYADASSNSAVSMVSAFVGGMRKGDMIFVSKGNKSIRAIGIVTGDYECLTETGIPFSQFRRVRWLLSGDADIPAEKLYRKGLVQSSIYELDRKYLNTETLKKLLSDGYTSKAPENYVLIIDEINRGNISKIFGEAITLLDPDKRLKAPNATMTTLPYSQKPFGLPSNLYILGTMNTADRSIALMDVALRRRFYFEELMPSGSVIRQVLKEKGTPSDLIDRVAQVFEVLNRRIEVLYDRDHQIGHSYFLDIVTESDLSVVWNEKILPLVQEYFYNDWDRLALLLGTESGGGFIRSLSSRDEYNGLFNGEDVEFPREIVFYNDPDDLMQALERAF